MPTLGHIPMRMITNGVVDRAVYSWIEDECSRSTVKNTLAILVRVLEQALFDAILADAGVTVVLSGVRMPRMNAVMGRWIQSCRHELLDRTLI